MKPQACISCAKRKVRCDRKEPCNNCRRRPKDRCMYVGQITTERVKKLEALVCSLGGSPEEVDSSHTEAARIVRPSPRPVRDQSSWGNERPETHTPRGDEPSMVREDGEVTYSEAASWHNWGDKIYGLDRDRQNGVIPRVIPTQGPIGVPALCNVLRSDGSVELWKRHPPPDQAARLWTQFHRNVNPLLHVCFDRELDALRAIALDYGPGERLSGPETALMFAIYFITVRSLPAEQCEQILGKSRENCQKEYQMLCEQALVRCDFLVSSDMTILQALTTYISAAGEVVSAKSLWSLMGLVIRNAERLGLHRDGKLLGSSPYETERKRRIWWQLQHLDLWLSARAGATSLTLAAEWDTELPLNIEDEDIDPSMTEPPKERIGLTSLSYCLFTYWVIYEQRTACKAEGRLSWLSWSSNRAWSKARKEALISKMEEGVNRKFLQYCDPVRPMDVLLSIVGRSLICLFRRNVSHAMQSLGSDAGDKEASRPEMLRMCMKSLEYEVATHSNAFLEPFRWRIRSYFYWPTLVYVLVEICRYPDTPSASTAWDLICKLYVCNKDMSDLNADRRRRHVAELVIAAWQAREKSLPWASRAESSATPLPAAQSQKPPFIDTLEALLAASRSEAAVPQDSHRTQADPEVQHQQPDRLGPEPGLPAPPLGPTDPMSWMTLDHIDLNSILGPDLDDIDWSFWNSFQFEP